MHICGVIVIRYTVWLHRMFHMVLHSFICLLWSYLFAHTIAVVSVCTWLHTYTHDHISLLKCTNKKYLFFPLFPLLLYFFKHFSGGGGEIPRIDAYSMITESVHIHSVSMLIHSVSMHSHLVSVQDSGFVHARIWWIWWLGMDGILLGTCGKQNIQ